MDTQQTAAPTLSYTDDPDKLQAFMGKMVGDMSAAISGALVIIGDKLGLYRALAEIGPATSLDLANRTGMAERYVREWLSAQAASGSTAAVPASRFAGSARWRSGWVAPAPPAPGRGRSW